MSESVSFVDYLRAEKVGTDVNVSFKMPIPTENGIQFPGSSGKLIRVFDDGIMMRASNGERFFRFSDCQSIDFPSSIALANGPIA